MKKYKYKAIATRPAKEDASIQFDRVMEGETYLVQKKENDNEFVRITGRLYNSNGGSERVCDKSISINEIKPYLQLIK